MGIVNSQIFFDNFALFADAPNGVLKLRELILQLAIEGKLVDQDSSDEPACVLLEKIKVKQQYLLEEGLIKEIKVRPLETLNGLELPNGWEWTRLGSISAKLGAGSTPLGGRNVYQRDGVKFLRSQNVWNDGLRLDTVAYISETIHNDMRGTQVEAGDILLNITGASIGRSCVAPNDLGEANVSQHVSIVRLIDKGLRFFIHLCLISPYVQDSIMRTQVGISREGLSMRSLKDFLLPIPPPEEQKRIVGKVHELMRLCDELEERRQRRCDSHVRFNNAILRPLKNSSSIAAEELKLAIGRLASNFATLYDSAETVSQLRSTILQLAVQGKLVSCSVRSPANGSKLYDYVKILNGYAFKSEWFVTSGIRLLRNANIGHGSIRWDEVAAISEERADEFARFALEEGDIVISLDRPIITTGLKVARISRKDLPSLLLQRVGKVRFKTNDLNSDYLFMWLNSPAFIDAIDPGRSNGVPHISSKSIEAIPFNPPTLAEQKRIVAKVNQLMSLCDELEVKLRKAETDSERLMNAAVQHVLQAVTEAGNSKRLPTAANV